MKHVFYALFFLITLLISCGKVAIEDEIKDGEKSCKIVSILRTVANYNGKTIAAISYDESDKIKSLISTSDSGFTSFTAIYELNKVTMKTRYYGDYVYNLDLKKRVVSAGFYTYGNKFAYVYNSDGYISSIVETNNNSGIKTTFNLFYSNGNLVRVFCKDIYDSERSIDFVYEESQNASILVRESDPLYYIGTYGGGQYVFPGIFGEVSKDLLKSVTFIRHDPNGYSGKEVFSLSYTRNAENRIASLMIDAPVDKVTYNFTYSCK